MPINNYPASQPGAATEGQALINATDAVRQYFAQGGAPLGAITAAGAIAAGVAELVSTGLGAPTLQTVNVQIPPTAAAAHAQVNVDFNPVLAGPNFAVVGVQVTDSTAVAGAAGLVYERTLSINAQSATLQFVNQGAGTDSGAAVVTVASYTASLTSNPSADPFIQAVRAVLTGNVQLYDRRYGVIQTAVGSNVMSRWDPVLGLAPPIVATASHNPTIDASGFINTDGVAQSALSAASAIFDQSLSSTLYVVGRLLGGTSSGTKPQCGVSSAANASSLYVVPGGNTLGNYSALINPGATFPNFPQPVTTAADSTVRVLVFKRNGTALTVGCLPSSLANTVAIGAGTSANASLALGADVTLGFFGQSSIAALCYCDHATTTAEDTAFYTYATNAHGDISGPSFFAHDGDSMTFGNGLTTQLAAYPTQLQIQLASLGFPNGYLNAGVTGKQLTGAGGLLATRPTLIDVALRSGRRNQFLIVWTLTNDYVAGVTPANGYAALQQYIQGALSAGWSFPIFVCTTLPRGDSNIETARLAGNTLIRNGAGNGYVVIDIASDNNLGATGTFPTGLASANTTFFNADQIHLNATGILQMIKTVVAIIRPYLH